MFSSRVRFSVTDKKVYLTIQFCLRAFSSVTVSGIYRLTCSGKTSCGWGRQVRRCCDGSLHVGRASREHYCRHVPETENLLVTHVPHHLSFTVSLREGEELNVLQTMCRLVYHRFSSLFVGSMSIT